MTKREHKLNQYRLCPTREEGDGKEKDKNNNVYGHMDEHTYVYTTHIILRHIYTKLIHKKQHLLIPVFEI